MFWDREQGVKKPFVHNSIANKIRIDLTKKIYRDEFDELNMIKSEAQEVLLGNANDFFKEFFEEYKNISDKDFLKTSFEMKADSENASGFIMNNRISPFILEDFGLKIFDFEERLPKTGRLNYGFLPAEMKSELEDIVTELIFTNDDFRLQFERYVDTSETIASYYSSNPDKLASARQKGEDEIIKKLCNKLLENIKKIDSKDYNGKNKKYQKAFRKTETLKIIKDLFSFLSRSSESQRHNTVIKNGELSKQAKKELAMKLEHSSSIDWERD